jgi:chromosomal replication initiation ATPase DnaA
MNEEANALRILRDILDGDEAELPAAMEEGRRLLAQLRAPAARLRIPRGSETVLVAVAEAVAAVYGFTLIKLRQRDKTQELATARMVGMALSRHYANVTLQAIARFYARKQHKAVVHAVRRVREMEATDRLFARNLNTARAEVMLRLWRAAP